MLAGADVELEVFHKSTLTSRVSLRSVLEAIAECAFPPTLGGTCGRASLYPVILSLECHCSLDGQEKMAALFVEVYGERLYRGNPNMLETPLSLQGKVIVKGKRSGLPLPGNGLDGLVLPFGCSFDDDSDADGSDDDADMLSSRSRQTRPSTPPRLGVARMGSSGASTTASRATNASPTDGRCTRSPSGHTSSVHFDVASHSPLPSAALWPAPPGEAPPGVAKDASWPSCLLLFRAQGSSLHSVDRSIHSSDALAQRRQLTLQSIQFKRKPGKTPRVSETLSAVTAMRAVRFTEYLASPQAELRARLPLAVCSFREGAALEMEREHQPQWLAHNEGVLSRVYPKRSRVDSSNVSELHACRLWAAGVQMLALNLQTWDGAAVLDEALFSLNGGCGYVLKPQLLPRGGPLTGGVLLSVRILCARNLPKGRDERLVARPWDEFRPQGSFAPTQLAPTGVVSPACEVELVGGLVSSQDSDVIEERWSRLTSTAADNGLNPSWADEEFRCACYTPEQSFIKLSVYNCRKQVMRQGSKQLLAYEAALVGALRPGYRAVQLRCPNGGSPIESCTLLVHVVMTPLPPRETLSLSPAAPDVPSLRATGRKLSIANLAMRQRSRSRDAVCGSAAVLPMERGSPAETM